MSSSLSSKPSLDGSNKRKALLTRSNAMCGDDDTRLRSPDQLEQCVGGSGGNGSLGTAASLNSRSKHYSTASTVSRDSSHTDYTDSTGVDLMQFIVNTLHKNAKDREMLLSLEAEMRKFVLDKSRQAYKFPKMSSYNRMLVHQVAAFFGLDHNIDQSGTLVVVTKTANTRIPDLEFAKCIKNNLFTDRLMFRRNVQSFDECQLKNIYANFPVVQPNLRFGSVAAMPAVGGPPLPPSLDLVRRARSFEVGEWHNSMATSAGGGSSNSSSSWQLVGGGPVVPYSSSRPDSIVLPGGGVLLDANSAIYYAAHPPLQAQFVVANNAQQSVLQSAEYLQPVRNGNHVEAAKVIATDGQPNAPYAGYVFAPQFYAAAAPQPVMYMQAGGSAPVAPSVAPSVPYDYSVVPPPSYYVVQNPAFAVPSATYDTTQLLNQQTASAEDALAKQFQQSVRVGSSDTSAGECASQPQLIPYNTPTGVCYITVGGRPATICAAQTPQNFTQGPAVSVQCVVARPPAEHFESTHLAAKN